MSEFLNDKEQSDLQNLSNMWMKANEEILQTVLNRNLTISPASIIDKPVNEETELLKNEDFYPFPFTLSSGILGNCYLVFPKDGLAVIVDLIIGGDGTSPMQEFNELHLGVLEEAISQIAGTFESILSDNLLRKINVRMGKPDANLRNLFKNWEMICLGYDFSIADVKDLRVEFLIPRDFSIELLAQIEPGGNNNSSESSSPDISRGAEESQGGRSMYRQASFHQLTDIEVEKKGTKLDLIMDIPLEMTVVLGKTGISMKDLVELGPGSILELEKLAGEPVELLVNDRLVGYGEVIVIEENFGVRVINVVENETSGGRKR